MNAERLLRLANVIEENNRMDMGSYKNISVTKNDAHTEDVALALLTHHSSVSCRTTACIAGEAALLSGKGSGSVYHIARNWLGLTVSRADWLFRGRWSPQQLDEKSARFAAFAVRHLVYGDNKVGDKWEARTLICEEPKRILRIVRGLPGSGKTSYAKYLAYKHGIFPHLEVDVIMSERGFKRNLKSYGLAHRICYGLTAKRLEVGQGALVANCFTDLKKLWDYLTLAAICKAPVEILEPPTEWAKNVQGCSDRNENRVTYKTIQSYARRWIDIKPGLYKIPQILIQGDKITMTPDNGAPSFLLEI